MLLAANPTPSGAPNTVAESIDAFRRERLSRDRLPYAARLAALNGLSDALMTRDPEVMRVLPAAGVAFAAAFLRATNLDLLVRREIPHTDALDAFVPLGARKSLRVLPQGLACGSTRRLLRAPRGTKASSASVCGISRRTR